MQGLCFRGYDLSMKSTDPWIMICGLFFIPYDLRTMHSELRNMFMFIMDGQWLIVDEFSLIIYAT